MFLILREVFRFTVNRSGGCVDYFFDAKIAGQLQNIKSSDPIDLHITAGIVQTDRLLDAAS